MILLLVEDESYTRNGIKKSIDWNELGIKEVLCAEDGAEGLNLAKENSPDIVLTDMRTPRMNGAKMAEEIHRLLPDCAFIFMSGYTDTDYFQSAIHVSALEYVEKPLKMEKLHAALVKACAHVEKLKTNHEYLTLSRNRELASILVQPQMEESEIECLWELNGLPDGKVKMACILFRHKFSSQIPQLIKKTAADFDIEAITARMDSFYLIHVIGRNDDELPVKEFTASLIGNPKCSENAFMAVGLTIIHPLEAHKSYISAKRAFDLSFYHSRKRILSDNPDALSLDMSFDPTNEFGQLIIHRSESIADWVNRLFETIRNYEGTPVILVKYWVYRMIAETSFITDKQQFDRKLEELNNGSPLWECISAKTTMNDLRDYMLRVVELFEEKTENKNEQMSTILAIKRYIYMHHNNPLMSLENIAEYVNLSPTYLCNVFKETTGTTVNNYLNSYRMDRARLYLSTTCMQVKEIAEKVGYSNSSYFIKLFRKKAGMTPQEFRNRNLYL